MRRQVLRLSPTGHAVGLLLSLALAATAPGWGASVACAVIVALAAVSSPGGLVVLRGPRLWLFTALLVIPAAFLLGNDAQSGAILQFSLQGLALGVQMALRALSILVAVRSFADAVSVGDLSQMLERIGLRGLGFALGVAVNMLPTIERSLTVTYQALRLCGGWRRPWLGLRLLLVTVTANSLRHADDIVGSAEARAFSPERVAVRPIVWTSADAWVIGILTATMLILWVALKQ